jgi:HK97 gp10 family phage protein
MQWYLKGHIKINLIPNAMNNLQPSGPVARDIAMKYANFVADLERQFVPVLTGALLDTIRVTPSGEGAIVTAGTPTIDYGWFQEFGTIYHRPQPFVRPAADGAGDCPPPGDYSVEIVMS